MQNKLKSHGISYDLEEIESMNKDLLFTEKKMRE